MSADVPTLADVALRAGVAPETLQEWVASGLVPAAPDGGLTAASVAQARMVARLRERGHTLGQIRAATDSGRLAASYVEGLVAGPAPTWTLQDAARETGLESELIERFFHAVGFGTHSTERLGDDDIELLRHAAAVLQAGFPLEAFLQLARVFGQALSQIADAEVRLFHLYVHEPLMRDGVAGWRVAEAMEGLARQILPLAAPIMDLIHQRFLQHFIQQDVIGHMEADFGIGDGSEHLLGRLRVGIAFADLAGYTRLTEELGDEEAVQTVERFVEEVTGTLPDDARIIKTIGDEVMVVGADVVALVDWAAALQEGYVNRRPLPRIGVHVGEALYRDGDYYGREVNQAARVAARAAGGEVLVTRPVVEAADRPGLEFERLGAVPLKGLREPIELFVARRADPD